MPRSALPSKDWVRNGRPSRRHGSGPLLLSRPQPPALRAGRNPPRERKERASRFPLKGVDKLAVTAHNVVHRVLAGDFLRTPRDERVPEAGPPYREADESRHGGRRLKPFMDLVVVFSAPQDNASDSVTTSPSCGGDHLLAIHTQVETFDLPDVRFHAGVLQFLDRLRHQLRA